MKNKLSSIIDTLLCVLFASVFVAGIFCILAGVNHF